MPAEIERDQIDSMDLRKHNLLDVFGDPKSIGGKK